jgi:hypothetical protein
MVPELKRALHIDKIEAKTTVMTLPGLFSCSASSKDLFPAVPIRVVFILEEMYGMLLQGDVPTL